MPSVFIAIGLIALAALLAYALLLVPLAFVAHSRLLWLALGLCFTVACCAARRPSAAS